MRRKHVPAMKVEAGVSNPARQVSHQTRPRTTNWVGRKRRSRAADADDAASAHSTAASRREARRDAIAVGGLGSEREWSGRVQWRIEIAERVE